jgi:oxygen-independent coproporphyrinogen-3 oxidase
MKSFSLYIHIPFCSHKCPYCDFNTYAVDAVPEAEYVAALSRELALYGQGEHFGGRSVRTIFFGGGTPSLFGPEAIAEILTSARRFFPLEGDAEISLEANPYLINEEKLRGYREAGVNRLSFGAQSFNPAQLHLLGREHSPSDIRAAVEESVLAGFDNVSLDILFGVPGQRVDDVLEDIEAATLLPVRHLSTYSLTIEPGTPFFQRQERKLFTLPSDEVVREMLDVIPDFLLAKGLSRYEISNYARPGFESKHNTAYWTGDDYLGVGAGAHSFSVTYDGELRQSGLRWSNWAHFDRYINETRTSAPTSWREHLEAKDLAFEFFYLGLRRTAGVSIEEFVKCFGSEAGARFASLIGSLESEGMMLRDGDRVYLTKNGIALADSVFERFVD